MLQGPFVMVDESCTIRLSGGQAVEQGIIFSYRERFLHITDIKYHGVGRIAVRIA